MGDLEGEGFVEKSVDKVEKRILALLERKTPIEETPQTVDEVTEQQSKEDSGDNEIQYSKEEVFSDDE